MTALEIAMKRADEIRSRPEPRPMPAWFASALQKVREDDFRANWVADGVHFAIYQMACEALGIEGLFE